MDVSTAFLGGSEETQISGRSGAGKRCLNPPDWQIIIGEEGGGEDERNSRCF